MVNITNISNKVPQIRVLNTTIQICSLCKYVQHMYNCHAIPRKTNGMLMFIYNIDVWVGSNDM